MERTVQPSQPRKGRQNPGLRTSPRVPAAPCGGWAVGATAIHGLTPVADPCRPDGLTFTPFLTGAHLLRLWK